MANYATTEETFTCITCRTRATEQQLVMHEKQWSMHCPQCAGQVLLRMVVSPRGSKPVMRAFVEILPDPGARYFLPSAYGRMIGHTHVGLTNRD